MTVRIISSKAPADVIRERIDASGRSDLDAQAGGGVDVEKRVAAGEPVDVVVLAQKAIARLADAGHVAPGSERIVLETEAVVAVRGNPPDETETDISTPDISTPDISTPEALRSVMEAANAIGISTGPSGDAVRAILDQWGLGDKAVTAPPGVPVGSLLIDGDVDLAVQQRTELEGLDGVTILGGLPRDLALVTRFVGAITTTTSTDPDAAAAALDLIAAPTTPAPTPPSPSSPAPAPSKPESA